MSSSDCSTEVEYREIAGFPGYRVGNDGTVWTCWQSFGRGSRLSARWKRLAESVYDGRRPDKRTPYHYVTLRRNGRGHYKFVHRLVLEAFVGPCPPGLQTRHRDGNAENNRLGNLRWGTSQENADDKRRHGTVQFGEDNSHAKITASDVRRIRRLLAAGVPFRTIAAEYGVTKWCIDGIAYRKAWSYVR